MLNPLLGVEFDITPDGHLVNANHALVAELVHDYNPGLEVCWIPPDKREPGDKPYAIVHNMPDGSRYPVFFLDEDEMDHRVIARLAMGDMSKAANTDILKWMEAEDTARQALARRKELDAMEEARDVASHILKSGKARYRHNGKVYE